MLIPILTKLSDSTFSRYKPAVENTEDITPDLMNILGMIFSMCGLMMRVSVPTELDKKNDFYPNFVCNQRTAKYIATIFKALGCIFLSMNK